MTRRGISLALASAAFWLLSVPGALLPATAQGTGAAHCEEDAACLAQFDQVGQAGVDTLARSIVHAVLAAKSFTGTGASTSYCDAYAGACGTGPSGYPNHPGKTGPNNNITDVPGVELGHYTDPRYLTGTSVAYFPKGGIVGVEVRGSAPASRESDILKPVAMAPRINAVMLSGGSSFGLAAGDGVARWLEEHGLGTTFDTTGTNRVPVVPAADIFDPGRFGKPFDHNPDATFGYNAIANHHVGTVAQGNVGAGAGAIAGSVKGGFGTASQDLGGGLFVGSIVDINAAGDVFDPGNGCRLYAADLQLQNEFAGVKPPPSGCTASSAPAGAGAAAAGATGTDPVVHGTGKNTTIGVVVTNMPLDKTMLEKLAQYGQDGESRSTRQSHTMFDGDTIFAVSTGGFTPEAPTAAAAPLVPTLPNTGTGLNGLVVVGLLLAALAVMSGGVKKAKKIGK
jgi:LPXTG-motif cell wall-anchored protein